VAKNRFSERDLINLWFVPGAVFVVFAAGFMVGGLVEARRPPTQPSLFPQAPPVLRQIGGVTAFAFYSAFLCDAVSRRHRRKSKQEFE